MASNTSQLVQDILQLYADRDLEGIISLISSIACNSSTPESDTLALRSLTWPLPRLMDLQSLAGFIKSHEGGHIYSIGCGTGLLEYLLLEMMHRPEPDVNEEVGADDGGNLRPTPTPNAPPAPCTSSQLQAQLTGIEIDSKWWTSPYAPPKFIDLLYVGETFPTEGHFGSPLDVILFSYFNSMKLFVDYLNRFQGKYVIIIGPNRSATNKKQYCAPSPLDLRDGDSDYDRSRVQDGDKTEETSPVPMEVDQDQDQTTPTPTEAAVDVEEPVSEPELPEPPKKRRRSSVTVTTEGTASVIATDIITEATGNALSKIPTEKWTLVLYQRFGLEEVDNVAIYSRK